LALSLSPHKSFAAKVEGQIRLGLLGILCASIPLFPLFRGQRDGREVEIFAEIDAPYLGIVAKRIRRPCPKDPSVANDVRTIGHRKSFANIVVSDQNPYAFLLEIADNALQLKDLYGVNSGKRFVQKNEIGLQNQ
jgi:hypothetical protein